MNEEKRRAISKKLFDEIQVVHQEFIEAYVTECADDDRGVAVSDIVNMNEQAIILMFGMCVGVVEAATNSIALETGDKALSNTIRSAVVGGALHQIQTKVLPDTIGKEGTLSVLKFMMDMKINGGSPVDKMRKAMTTPDIGSSFTEMMAAVRKPH